VEISVNEDDLNGLASDDVTEELESCFDEVATDWLAIGKELSSNNSAGLAHTPACVANASDFGQMLAWSKLISRLISEPKRTLVICGDPWMYRHLQKLRGMESGPRPAIVLTILGLWLRGYAARLRATLKLAFTFLKLRRYRSLAGQSGSVILVYGHPNSSPEGQDGYFGNLARRNPSLTRILHVDCDLNRVLELEADKNTSSLHAWGSLWDLAVLPFAKWRPGPEYSVGDYGWLICRSAALEGGTGQGAMIEWQIRCQARWLKKCKPEIVAWPWENHSWERQFVREAKRNGVRTIGYQHSVIGRQMLNYSPGSNADGLASLPDKILCTGRAMVYQLRSWQVPDHMMDVGGAFRFNAATSDNWDPAGAVYIALPFDLRTSAELLSVARKIAKNGYNFNVKPHPMTPYQFSDGLGITTTDAQFFEQKQVSVVIYAASAVGLESVLAGMPTIRFRPSNRVSLDILPREISLPASGASGLEQCLREAEKPKGIDREDYFAPVSMGIWRKELGLQNDIR